jgi:hypothetical protein
MARRADETSSSRLLGCCFIAASLAVVSRTHNPLYTSENTPGTFRTIYLKEREKPFKTIGYQNMSQNTGRITLPYAIFTKAYRCLSSLFWEQKKVSGIETEPKTMPRNLSFFFG